MIGIQWIFFLVTGKVTELETTVLAISFHLVAVLATAITLIFAGIGLLRRSSRPLLVTMLALGMLLYTIINSAGYFAEQGVWIMVGLFGVLLILTLCAVWILIKGNPG